MKPRPFHRIQIRHHRRRWVLTHSLPEPWPQGPSRFASRHEALAGLRLLEVTHGYGDACTEVVVDPPPIPLLERLALFLVLAAIALAVVLPIVGGAK